MPETKEKSTTPDFNKLELDILNYWDENKTFEKSLEQTKGGEPYIFYDGPPFATGLPHYGSILPSVIKDAIPRYQTMRGRFVRRRWGWDCHGLPIENIVEQHLKISGKKQIEEIGVARFNQVCRENVLTYVKEWGKMVHRIARWVDFGPPPLWPQGLSEDSGGPSAEALAKADNQATADVAQSENMELRNSYKTMDTTYMESVWWALKQIWDKDLIYEDRKVLLYCSRCETPISNFEVAMDNSYRDITEQSVFAKFRINPSQRIADFITNDKTYALAWTTTPWTLPGNTALNVGPDISYVLVEQNEDHYILAKDRLEILEGEYEVVSEFSARSLDGLQYEPLYSGVVPNDEGRAHKIYTADFVTTTDGTGIVHNAAMYGEDDYQLAKEKDLPRVDMLDHKGQYLDRAPENLRGVFFKDADPIIIADLKNKGLVYKTENYTHSYPHCYRCGTPLFYNALPAWFINVQKVKPDLLKLNENINWYPPHLKHGRFKLGIENAPDWNISRNRYWATALPFWKCSNQECKDVICIGSIDELREKSLNFSEVYSDYDPANLEKLDLHKPYIDQIKLKCEKCGGEMSRIPEVIDCWVESGSMPFAELHAPFENQEVFKQRFPSDFVVEYIPQTRAWFYVMHVISSILFGSAPFKNVLTTGTILAEDGSKMSKSKQNFPDPNLVIERYGADALRFYLLTSPVVNGEDMNFSEKGVAEVNRKVNLLIWNVFGFYSMYTSDLVDPESKPVSDHVLDRWILAKLSQLQAEVTANLDHYDTVRAGRAVTEFIDDLSTWYLRRSRDRIKAGGDGGKQALAVLGYALVKLSQLLAPFTPFLSEHIYRSLTGKESVHLTGWDMGHEGEEIIVREMAVVREAVSMGHALRKELGIPVRQPLQSVAIDSGDTNLSPELTALILEELNVKTSESSLVDKAASYPDVIAKVPGAQHVKYLYLDKTITPQLKAEGLARAVERQVQDLRKKSGLKVGELVDLYYNTQDEELETVINELLDRKKTFVNQVKSNLEIEADYEIQADVDGKAVWLGLVKV